MDPPLGIKWNFKVLALTVHKLLARLNFQNKVKLQGQGHRVKIVGTHGKILSLVILMCSKVIRKVKVYKRIELQYDRMTEETKKISPQLWARGHKIGREPDLPQVYQQSVIFLGIVLIKTVFGKNLRVNKQTLGCVSPSYITIFAHIYRKCL